MATKKPEIVMESDNTIDVTKIEDPTVRALVEQMIQDEDAKRRKLEESLKQTRAELEEMRRARRSTMSPGIIWKEHVDQVVNQVEDAQDNPLTFRQRKNLVHCIRMISREVGGRYRIGHKKGEELDLMLAVANRIGEVIIEFGIPEETDETFQMISKNLEGKRRKKK